MVSLHAPTAARHDAFTGVPGSFAAAVRALALCREAGLVTAINCCPADGQGLKDDLEAIVAGARRHGCAYVQFIHPKAAGAWLGRDEVVRGRTGFLELLRRSGRRRRNVPPAVCSQADEEAADRFGCTAGGIERFYVGAGGEVQPCEFLNLSVGRLGDEAFPVLLRRLRAFFPRPTTAWPCCDQAIAIAAAIRAQGGRTPLPWPASRPLLEALSVGDEPAVYRRLGIYRCGSR
jgi:MoaA/NifB/PqqE/SkfB family radical SAM enzyme